MMLIDAHAHLDRYPDAALDGVLEEIERDGIFTVSTAMDPSSYERSLLTETDNPDGLHWLTGVLGMPRHPREVVGKLAERRKTTPETIIAATRENLVRLMRDDPRLAAAHRLLAERGTAACLHSPARTP